MKRRISIVALVALIAAVMAQFVPRTNDRRGVTLVSQEATIGSQTFDYRQSAGLFVGVRVFKHDEMLEVRYAADDAVDLAYMFALDPRVRLLPAERVVIALSGKPQKAESKKHLEELIEAGARVESAETTEILSLLQQQAAMAGRDGILIVSLATHGFVRKGVPYVLGSTSLFRFPETALPTPRLFDLAAMSDAKRSLFFIDACRERITDDARSGTPETAGPLINRMGRVNGQVVFYAAAAGGWSYEGDGNGVFTRAVLDGFGCQAKLVRGAVTVATLHAFAERQVREWIRIHKHLKIGAATQISMEGDTKNMPLSVCDGPRPPVPAGNVDHATFAGSAVTAFSANGTRLWSASVKGNISRVDIADLDADNGREVVAGADAITVFDRAGEPLWFADEGTLRAFRIEDLLRGDPTQQIVVLSESRVAVYSAKGHRLSAYHHPRPLMHLAVDRQTSHHVRRIIVAGTNDVTLLDAACKVVWTGSLAPSGERIARLQILDSDNDAKRDVAITTESRRRLYLGFAAGNVLAKSSQRLRFTIQPAPKR